jgi:SAM-dependent methyltransferase
MSPKIKIDLDGLIKSGKKVVLELGCGPHRKEGRIGIDRLDLPSVDIVSDLEDGLSFLPDKSVDEIHCRSVLEHIENFENLMREIVRVLKNDGLAYIYVPHFSNPYFYSDYTHKRFFGLYTFYYFVDTKCQLKRKVPDFYPDFRINIISQKLVFKSPFFFRGKIKKFIGFIFNCHRSLQEFYEENLCYIFPCYGIKVVFTPAP